MRSAQGEALIRVVQESVRQHSVTVSDGSRTLGGPLQLGSYTSFLPVSPGRQAIRAVGYSETTTKRVSLPPNTIHTLVVLDKPSGLRISSIQDAVGSRVMPAGGAATGFGGTAPRGASPAPWLMVITGGALLAAVSMIRLRRTRRDPAPCRYEQMTGAPAGGPWTSASVATLPPELSLPGRPAARRPGAPRQAGSA